MHPRAFLATVRIRLRALLLGGREARQFDDEMAFHLEMETRKNIAAGMPPAEARRAAILAFGGVERVREDRHDASGVRVLNDAMADLRYAVRWLRRSPAFTASALLTLALGIGAASAIFAIVNGVLLKPLPYPQPDELVAVWSRIGSDTSPATSSPPDYREFRDNASTFSAFGAYYASAANVAIDGEPQRLAVRRVSASLFPLLGATYSAGRGFRADEEEVGRDRVVVISHRTWMAQFGGRPGLVGSSISIEGEPHQVVGITAPDFRFLDSEAQLWRPIAFSATDNLNTRGNYFVFIVGRLRPGETPADAVSDLQRVVTRVRSTVPDAPINGAFVIPLHEQVVGSTRTALLLLLVATGVLMLIACANVAGLLLARATARERELAVRAGLGASRGRIVRQLVTEALLLGALGAALGLGVTTLSLRALKVLNVGDVPRMDEVTLDPAVFLGAVGMSLLAAVAFGLWPALRLTRVEGSHDALRAGARSSAGGHLRMRRALVGAQVALAMLLLIGSGLLIRSFTAVLRVDPGFSVANIVTGSLPVNSARYDDDPPRLTRFADAVLERVRSDPRVESAAITSGLSLRGGGWGKLVTLADRALPTTREEVPAVGYRLVSPGYFETMGVRRVSGRVFTDGDRAGTQPVAVVNETFARRFWPQGKPDDAIGKVIWMGPPEDLARSVLPSEYRFPRLTIIGVVADERFAAIDAAPQAEVYQVYSQTTETASTLFLAARTRANPGAVVAHMRASVREVDPLMPLAQVATMGELLRDSSARRRVGALLVSVFAVLSLVLAVVGIYGVAAQFVAQRTRELGIRLAVGASRGDVMRLVLREGGVTALAGALVGIAFAVVGSRYLKAVLFGVTPTDPATYGAIALILLGAVLFAVGIPARRAARIPPGAVLRGE